MPLAEKTGLEGILQYKVGGVAGGGAWITIGNIENESVPMSGDELKMVLRDGNGWEGSLPGPRKMRVDFTMSHRPGDAAFDAIKDSFLQFATADKVIGIRSLDHEPDGSASGFQYDGYVSKLEWKKDAGSVQMYDVSIPYVAGGSAPEAIDSI